jgi:ribonuclease Z
MQLNDRKEPLHIYGPKGMNKLTKELLSLGYFRPTYKIISHEIEPGDIFEFKGYSIKTLKANHGVPSISYCLEEIIRPGKFNKKKALALGIPEGHLFSKIQKGNSIKLKDGRTINPEDILGKPRKGRKVVYSGDTKPVKNMIDFSKNADILIHEATFHSDLQDNANDYGHTTAKQAAEIAKQANVEKLYLTHISPRYLDEKIIEKDAKEIFKKSYVPKDFDNVEVSLKN